MGSPLHIDVLDVTKPATALADPAHTLLQGNSDAATTLRARLQSVAPFFRTALITGEGGSGKLRTARELHRLSHPDSPFVVFKPSHGNLPEGSRQNCRASHASSPNWAELLESAQGGTLVVKDLGSLSPADQASLSRWMRQHCWQKLAFHRTQIIGTSCVSANSLQKSGQLPRELHDLFSAVEIRVPPLRDRLDDLAEIASALLAEAALDRGWQGAQLSPEALTRLRRRPWPGNIAQLRSVLHAALESESRHALRPELLDMRDAEAAITAMPQASMRLQDAVDAHVLKVLSLCHGNKLKTAELLGVSRSTLYRMLETMP